MKSRALPTHRPQTQQYCKGAWGGAGGCSTFRIQPLHTQEQQQQAPECPRCLAPRSDTRRGTGPCSSATARELEVQTDLLCPSLCSLYFRLPVAGLMGVRPAKSWASQGSNVPQLFHAGSLLAASSAPDAERTTLPAKPSLLWLPDL